MTEETGSDPVLFARYAYPPNALGYCGPADPSALLGCASEGAVPQYYPHLARQFLGAWPYLELIAAANRIGDPLDRRVVEAYWVGNDLLRAVPPAKLADLSEERFSRPCAPAGGIAQHSFHVFAVYPWLGLLRSRTGVAAAAALEVLDRCRIRWGRVEAVAGGSAVVRSRHLVFDRSRLALGPEQLEEARHHPEGLGPGAALSPGDMVALHWDWICDRLAPGQLRWLRYGTRRNLAAVNSLDRSSPAVICDA